MPGGVCVIGRNLLLRRYFEGLLPLAELFAEEGVEGVLLSVDEGDEDEALSFDDVSPLEADSDLPPSAGPDFFA